MSRAPGVASPPHPATASDHAVPLRESRNRPSGMAFSVGMNHDREVGIPTRCRLASDCIPSAHDDSRTPTSIRRSADEAVRVSGEAVRSCPPYRYLP